MLMLDLAKFPGSGVTLLSFTYLPSYATDAYCSFAAAYEIRGSSVPPPDPLPLPLPPAFAHCSGEGPITPLFVIGSFSTK